MIAVRESTPTRPPPAADRGRRLAEARAFLGGWPPTHFTFLGYRAYDLEHEGRRATCSPSAGSGLGILREAGRDARAARAAAAEGRAYARGRTCCDHEGQRALDRAPPDVPRLHRHQALRRGRQRGGEHRFLGLYTSSRTTGARSRSRCCGARSLRGRRVGLDRRASRQSFQHILTRFRTTSCSTRATTSRRAMATEFWILPTAERFSSFCSLRGTSSSGCCSLLS